ncbi:conserved hypothetical protein [Candidatus Accumulibacter aalborgensis]|uniref:Uncharacterized protein n=1 Tax=Candidatus Accumulibacter aalborgensis TaxID=1860102 RepID=A0A1A8XJC2_9PROT|nr:conserved hypothetical protein [Candidatus Accumulibacter aalborgensis]
MPRTPAWPAGAETHRPRACSWGAKILCSATTVELCSEATTSAIHRAALKSEAAHHSAPTNLFTGRPARGIMNRIMRELGPINALAPKFPLANGAIAPLRAKAQPIKTAPLFERRSESRCGYKAKHITENRYVIPK